MYEARSGQKQEPLLSNKGKLEPVGRAGKPAGEANTEMVKVGRQEHHRGRRRPGCWASGRSRGRL